MSFSVSTGGGAFEYRARALGLLAQPSNLLRPSYRRMVREIVRFSREAKALVGREPGESTGEWLDRAGYSSAFRDDFLLPMVACIWSSNLQPDALLPGGDDGRLPRQPRPARSREPPAVAHRDGREPRVRASGRLGRSTTSASRPRSIRWCANPTRCWSRDTARDAGTIRPRGPRHARRHLAEDPRPRRHGRASATSCSGVPLSGEPGRAASRPRLRCRGGAEPGRAGTTWRGSATAAGAEGRLAHLLDEPAAEPRHRAPGVRDAQPGARAARIGSRRSSTTIPQFDRAAVEAQAGCRRCRACAAPGSAAATAGTASTRTACARGSRSRPRSAAPAPWWTEPAERRHATAIAREPAGAG